MTRSDISPHSPRVVRKAFRAQAASKGLSFKEAILANKVKDEEEAKKFEKPVGGMRRNPGRMDGVQWNGDSFVCTRQIDGDEPVIVPSVGFARQWESDLGDDVSEEKPSYKEPTLMDIARPAKRRGKKNKAMQRILDSEDDNRSERSEDWEGSDVWDMHSEHWETQSELWEIPEGDHGPDEWEELSSVMYNDGEMERRDSR
ncbi:peptide hydrolase [Favolaschia claudopus]|uniref:Peptide hydrolase n=1 Tax=Favolaschia claudopus TaxID=2862362 RepID=A0AAW0D471_9AGAR